MKRIWGVTFYVSNLKRSIFFYEETLGLNKKYEYSNYAGFDCGGVEIGLIPKEKVAHGGNIPSVEFLVDNVDAAYHALKKKGVKFLNEPHNEPWGGRKAGFIDPDGNILEITQIDWKEYFNAATKGFKKL